MSGRYFVNIPIIDIFAKNTLLKIKMIKDSEKKKNKKKKRKKKKGAVSGLF